MIEEFGQGKYYLYRHIRLDKNQPFYIGIGTKWVKDIIINNIFNYRRAKSKTGRSKIWYDITKKSKYIIEILFESNNREFIKTKEVEFIKLYGKIKDKAGGILSNISDGGDLGIIPSNKVREKMSLAKIGKKQSQESINKRRESLIKKFEIKQFDINGNLLNIFPCPKDASIITGKSATHINNSVKDKVLYCDYIWMYSITFSKKELQERINKYKFNLSLKGNTCNKIVLQFDNNKNFIKEWRSLTEIKNILKYDKDNISEAIKNNRTANNFYWKFK